MADKIIDGSTVGTSVSKQSSVNRFWPLPFSNKINFLLFNQSFLSQKKILLSTLQLLRRAVHGRHSCGIRFQYG